MRSLSSGVRLVAACQNSTFIFRKKLNKTEGQNSQYLCHSSTLIWNVKDNCLLLSLLAGLRLLLSVVLVSDHDWTHFLADPFATPCLLFTVQFDTLPPIYHWALIKCILVCCRGNKLVTIPELLELSAWLLTVIYRLSFADIPQTPITSRVYCSFFKGAPYAAILIWYWTLKSSRQQTVEWKWSGRNSNSGLRQRLKHHYVNLHCHSFNVKTGLGAEFETS